MNAPISPELVRRCEERRLCTTVTAVCAILGEAIDAGLITLPALLDLVRSCATADQLGDALTMLAATVPVPGISEQELSVPAVDDWPPVGWPPAPPGRFRVVGERED